jgi:hypothetical protein
MNYRFRLGLVLVAFGAIAAAVAGTAPAQLFINEMYMDPPMSYDELSHEYIELRGTPGMTLADHYLIMIENEDALDQSGEAGLIENVFDLGGHSMGTNGFLTIRRAGNPYSVALGTTDVIVTNDVLENSGYTAMLIHKGTGPIPTLGMILDGEVDNDGKADPDTMADPTPHDGLDYPGEGQPGWTILDAIGFFGESREAGTGRLYAMINFGPERIGQPLPPSQGGGTFTPKIEPGAVYISTGYEIELVARYGNSTGQTAKDWHMTNVTDNSLAGFVNAANGFRQSGPDPHGLPRPDGEEFESNQFVPYGTNMTDTLGAPNYPLNQSVLPWDYNQNGVVDAADFTVWRDALGTPDPTGTSLLINADLDGSVDQTEYDAWKFHFGETLLPPGSAALAGSATVPEPAGWLLVVLGIILVPTLRVGTRTVGVGAS